MMPLDTGYGEVTAKMKAKLPELEAYMEIGMKLSGPQLSDNIFGSDETTRQDREPKNTPNIRAMILHLRLKGVPIASDHAGYWLAKNLEELQPTIDEFKLLAMRKSIVANQLAKAFEFENQRRLL